MNFVLSDLPLLRLVLVAINMHCSHLACSHSLSPSTAPSPTPSLVVKHSISSAASHQLCPHHPLPSSSSSYHLSPDPTRFKMATANSPSGFASPSPSARPKFFPIPVLVKKHILQEN